MLSVSHMTPEQEVARKKQLVSAAKALLSLQVGIGVGCIRISKLLYWLGLEGSEHGQVFKQFIDVTRDIPIGNDRLHWVPEALLEQDAKLMKFEAKFRPAILSACVAIIATYG